MKLDGAILNGAQVHGVSAWEVAVSENAAKQDLVISRAAGDRLGGSFRTLGL